MKTKIVILSDTHNQHSEISVPDGDILIHCGDATNLGTMPEIHDFSMWWNKLPHATKIFVPGNHDFGFQEKRYAADSLVKSLQNHLVVSHSLRIWGSPWTPSFGGWAFMEEDSKLERHWSLIPKDIDILITHGPAYGHLDEVSSKYVIPGFEDPKLDHAGSKSLLAHITASKPKIHVFGHIHSGYGVKNDPSGVRFVNAALCDDHHDLVNVPQVLTVSKRGKSLEIS